MRVAMVTQVIEGRLLHKTTTLIVNAIGSAFPIEDLFAPRFFSPHFFLWMDCSGNSFFYLLLCSIIVRSRRCFTASRRRGFDSSGE